MWRLDSTQRSKWQLIKMNLRKLSRGSEEVLETANMTGEETALKLKNVASNENAAVGYKWCKNIVSRNEFRKWNRYVLTLTIFYLLNDSSSPVESCLSMITHHWIAFCPNTHTENCVWSVWRPRKFEKVKKVPIEKPWRFEGCNDRKSKQSVLFMENCVIRFWNCSSSQQFHRLKSRCSKIPPIRSRTTFRCM